MRQTKVKCKVHISIQKIKHPKYSVKWWSFMCTTLGKVGIVPAAIKADEA